MRLHLGCGSNYIEGWVNIDLDAPDVDANLDLRDPLPFDDATTEFIFNEHFIEHIAYEDALRFLRECHRVLMPGGVLRLSTPDLRWLIAKYNEPNLTEWRDVGWLPQSPCQLINEGMRSWGHQFVYDREEIQIVLRRAGFADITACPYRQSMHAELQNLECRPWHHELILEATK